MDGGVAELVPVYEKAISLRKAELHVPGCV